MDIEPSDTSRQRSEETRSAILSYISRSMKPIRVDDLKVVKTLALKQQDREEIRAIDGAIHGYNVRLKQANAKAENLLARVEATEKTKSDLDQEIGNIDEELKEKDSAEHVTAAEWSIKQKWKLMEPRLKQEVECASPWPIATYTTWDNGNLKWEDLVSSKYKLTGLVRGKFWRGLYANVTLKTCKRDKYVDVINYLQKRRHLADEERENQKAMLDKYRQEGEEYSNEVQLLQEYIEEKNRAKKQLSLNYLSLEEAEKKLMHCTSNETTADCKTVLTV